MEIRSVLVAVDFGGASARAVAAGGAVAACGPGTALRLLHAESIEAPAYFTLEQIADLEHQRLALTSQAERFLSEFGRQHTSVPFTATVARRLPAEAILAAAAGADLIVMGTHGRHGPQRWWLGSVAERVLRDIKKPLLIVRGDGDSAAPDRLFRRTLVHAAAPLRGDAAVALAHEMTSCAGGTVIDQRQRDIVPALERTRPTLLAAAVPEPRTAAWMSAYGEPLVRFCTVPILFVPEIVNGGSS